MLKWDELPQEMQLSGVSHTTSSSLGEKVHLQALSELVS